MSRMFIALTIVSVFITSAQAEVQTKRIAYEQGGEKLEGVLAWDDAHEGKRPGVLVVHEWWGLNDYVEGRAEELAELGYVAFALDMYGKGQVTSHPKEAGEWSSKIRSNTEEWRARALAGLDILKKQPQVDTSNMAAIGYCFGGSTVLQLAYANAPVKGVVSFHGALVAPENVKEIQSTVLVCNGAKDSFVSSESVQKFESAMNGINADYYLISYGGARHGFTNPNAGEFGIENLQYNQAADRRSWRQMKNLFSELFGKKSK